MYIDAVMMFPDVKLPHVHIKLSHSVQTNYLKVCNYNHKVNSYSTVSMYHLGDMKCVKMHGDNELS